MQFGHSNERKGLVLWCRELEGASLSSYKASNWIHFKSVKDCQRAGVAEPATGPKPKKR